MIDDGPPGGIIVVSANQKRLVVGTGHRNYGGIFAQFSDNVNINNSGSVLFNAALKLGTAAQACLSLEGITYGQWRRRSGFSVRSEFGLGLRTGLSDDGAATFIAAAAILREPLASTKPICTQPSGARLSAMG